MLHRISIVYVSEFISEISRLRHHVLQYACVLCVRKVIYSSEAKASRVIICKFPVKLPFPVYSGLQRASTSRHIHSDGVPGRPALHHVRMCQYVFALFAFSDDDCIRQWRELAQ